MWRKEGVEGGSGMQIDGGVKCTKIIGMNGRLSDAYILSTCAFTHVGVADLLAGWKANLTGRRVGDNERRNSWSNPRHDPLGTGD